MSLKKLVEEITKPILQEGINDPGILKAVFLAGGPGSGKGFVSKGLFGIPKTVNTSAYGLKVVNQDKALETLLKKYGFGTDLDDMPEDLFRQLTDPDYEDYSGMRSYAKDITKQQKKQYMNGRLGMIIDGTGHKYGSILKKKKELEEIGYDCFMVFVHTDLEVAQKRNMERPRKLSPELVETSWNDVQKNKISFQGLFGNANFMMVDNSKTLGEKAAINKFDMLMKKGINKFIKKPIKNHLGKKWIAKQKIMKESINEANAVKGSKVEKFITGHNLTMKGKKYKEIEFETLGIDNSSKMVKLRIIAPKNLFGMETPVKFATLRRGPFTKTDTGKKVNEKLSRKDQIKQNKLRDERQKLIKKAIGFGSGANSHKLKLQIKDIEKQIAKLNEAPSKIKKTIGVFGGRFQPFHSGHLATYKWLAKQVDEAYITTTNIKKPPRHPMNFKEKVRHMTKMGIPANRIIEERTPYVAKNLLKKFNTETTAVVYAFGQKDAGRLKAGTKKSGGKTYYQDYKKNKNDIKGYEEHGYFITAPQFGNLSGTKTRDMLGNPKIDDKEKKKFFKKTFGYFDKGLYIMMTNKFKKLFEYYVGLFENSGTHTAGEVDDGPGFLSSLKAYQNRAETEAGKLGWEIAHNLIDDEYYYSQDFGFVKDTEYPKGPIDSVSFGPAGVQEPSAQNLTDYVGTELWNKWLDHIDMILKNQDYEYVDDMAKARKAIVKDSPKTAKQLDAEEPEETKVNRGNKQHDEYDIVKEVLSLTEVSAKVKMFKQRLMRRGIKIRYSKEEAQKDLVKKYGGKGHVAAKKFGLRKAYYAVPSVGSKPNEKPKLVINKPEMEKLHKDKQIDKGNLKVVYKEQKELLLMGGAYGHMSHPFDDKELTFKDLKNIITMGLGGQLNREDNVTEKTDGQNLMISWKNGKLISARNKGHIKNKGKTALSIKDVESKFKGRGDIRNAFVYAVRDLSKAIGALSDKQRTKIFGEGSKWMSLEVMWPASENVVNYDITELMFHGTLEYDDSARVIGQAKDSARILAGMIKQVNQNIQKHYKIKKPHFMTVPKHQDFGKLKGKFLSRLKKLQSQYSLKDNDTLALYHQSYWQEWIFNGAKQTDYQNITNEILVKLTKRWAFFDKSYKIPQIKKDLKEYPKFLEWVLSTDKNDHAKMVKNNMKPFEELFFEVGATVLKNMDGWMAVNPAKSVQNMRKKLQSAIKDIRSGGDIKKLNKLKIQLDRLNAIGGLDAVVPTEGIVFKYNGNVYKFTGAFAPLNQITGLMTF